MSISEIIALGALAVSVLMLLLNSRRGTQTDAAAQAKMETKLDAANAGIADIRVEMRSLRNDLADQGQRLAKVENSAASAHHRLDDLERFVRQAHPPDGGHALHSDQ